MAGKVTQEFRSPQAKIRRARSHVRFLAQKIGEYVAKTTSQRIIEELTPTHGAIYQRWLRVYAGRCREAGRAPVDPPDETAYLHKIHLSPPSLDDLEDLSVVASDAIQNLRQSLDHAACACARAADKSDKGTYFPLIAAGEDIEAAIKDKARKLPPTVKDIIRRVAHGHLLYELHDAGIVDKHRLLCGLGGLGSSDLGGLYASATGWIAAGFDDDEWDPINHDIRFAMTGSPNELDYKFGFSFEIRLNAGRFISAKPLVASLGELANACDSIIGEMETEMARLYP